MDNQSGVMTLEFLIDSTAAQEKIVQDSACSGCSNSCRKKNTIDIVREVKLKSKCCKKYKKKKKSFCSRCPEADSIPLAIDVQNPTVAELG